ncbi:hypothetical protein NIES2119_21240 [[Phormidium ambiguum] IAM M-71]|uniref:DUF5648 domain-containing protein n=1 Tax=[Phormidium ambiguum] IAM M-71 TaxID=454136 RepID=A0A1U7IBL5_9CYAN|nr:hypothetical protein [Phormidium ambiguum]OKH34034.1 hypothetical protein NIES2119_21240 [Phormidium ambiguum IAM M-71]
METQAFQQLHEDVVIYADYYTNEPQILAAGYGFEGIMGIPGLLTESQIGLAVQAGAGIISANLNQNPAVPLRNITSAASVAGITAAGYGNVTDTFLDAMPIEFSHPLLPSTVDPTDIQITLNTGEVVQPLYAALNPNYDFNERQTIVVFGYFGNRLTPGTSGAVYPILVEVVADQTPLTVVTANGLQSAVGFQQTSSNPFVSGPQLVGAKLSQLSLAGDYAPSRFNANLPNHGYAYYASAIDRPLYRLRLFTSGGFSPDGVSGFEPGDFERYFILRGIDSQGQAFTITQDQTTYTTSDGVIQVLGIAELGSGLGSGPYYTEDHDNQFDIILAGDEAAISKIATVQIPDYTTTNYSPIYNPGGPGDSPVDGLIYTQPAAPQVFPVLNSLDNPRVVSYASQNLADYMVDTNLPVAFRLQDPRTGSHFWTASSTEANDLVTAGWKFESVPFAVNPQDSFTSNIYRLYNSTTGDHLLTASEEERSSVIAQGYIDQGIAFTAYTTPSPGLEEVYRLFSPLGTDRLYTTSEQERFRWEKLGYQFEGVAFWAPSFPSDSTITPVVDYQQFLRYQNPAASTPTDSINGLPLAQLFDENYYLSQMPDVANAVRNGDFSSGYQHFITFGWNEGRNPSILFDENYYRASYSDVNLAIANKTISSGLAHFLNFGHQEQRNPSEAFSQSDYLINNPDVAAAVNNGSLQSAFQHYITFGADEGRLPDLFLYNEAYYLQHNPDVVNAIASDVFADGYEHFVRFGQTEKRDPSFLYNETMYLGLNSDVANAVANGTFKSGFQHYELFGRFEERLI